MSEVKQDNFVRLLILALVGVVIVLFIYGGISLYISKVKSTEVTETNESDIKLEQFKLAILTEKIYKDDGLTSIKLQFDGRDLIPNAVYFCITDYYATNKSEVLSLASISGDKSGVQNYTFSVDDIEISILYYDSTAYIEK